MANFQRKKDLIRVGRNEGSCQHEKYWREGGVGKKEEIVRSLPDNLPISFSALSAFQSTASLSYYRTMNVLWRNSRPTSSFFPSIPRLIWSSLWQEFPWNVRISFSSCWFPLFQITRYPKIWYENTVHKRRYGQEKDDSGAINPKMKWRNFGVVSVGTVSN